MYRGTPGYIEAKSALASRQWFVLSTAKAAAHPPPELLQLWSQRSKDPNAAGCLSVLLQWAPALATAANVPAHVELLHPTWRTSSRPVQISLADAVQPLIPQLLSYDSALLRHTFSFTLPSPLVAPTTTTAELCGSAVGTGNVSSSASICVSRSCRLSARCCTNAATSRAVPVPLQQRTCRRARAVRIAQ